MGNSEWAVALARHKVTYLAFAARKSWGSLSSLVTCGCNTLSKFSLFWQNPTKCTLLRRRLQWAACYLSLYLFLSACSLMPGSSSSGLMLDGNKPPLPQGVPSRVAVAPFSGESPISSQSADQFSNGLIKLGFDVIERQHFDKIAKELEFQHSGMISDESAQAVGKQLGAEGIFVGSVEGRSKSGFVNTFLNVKLVEIQTGKTLWAGTFSDPRIFVLTDDVKTSIIYTTREALESLEGDMGKARR